MGTRNSRKEPDCHSVYQSSLQCRDRRPRRPAAICRRCNASVLPDRGSQRGQERFPGKASARLFEVPTLSVTSATAVAQTGFRIWLLAARPATLPAAIVPVLVGTGAALHGRREIHEHIFIPILLAALLIQIGTNFANDVFDFRRGADTAERLGPLRATQAGLISPQQMLKAAYITFGLALLIGLYLVILGGWPILLIGVVCLLAGVLYTGGPWPFGYHSLGDLVCFVCFGVLAVLGTAYIQTHTIT